MISQELRTIFSAAPTPAMLLLADAPMPPMLLADAPTCSFAQTASQCNGLANDTVALQRALDDCVLTATGVELRAGANCTVGPLRLPGNSHLFLASGARLQALDRTFWPSSSPVSPPLLLAQHTSNITIMGEGTIDGRGEQWWPRPAWLPISDRRRPIVLNLDTVDDVRLESFRIVNPARFAIAIGGGGHRYSISRLTVRAPDFETAPNTDGIDIAAYDVHVDGVDIANGDDSLCIKSPAGRVLIENSVVSGGNGLVVGTSDVVNIENITFRNITAHDTTFGCHIKFKGLEQSGHVRNVTFQDIAIYQSAAATWRRVTHFDHRGYAIGVHQNDQGIEQRPRQGRRRLSEERGRGSGVHIDGITFRRIQADVLYGGEFICNGGPLACTGLHFEHVHLNASRAGCVFKNAVGTNDEVEPASCRVPKAATVSRTR